MRWGVGGLVVSLIAVPPAAAQARPSEQAMVRQILAGDTITIDYYRPSLRGRDSIFGSQVAWNHVWTPGANRATTLATTKPITIEGRRVEPGRYGVWLEVRRDSAWTFHLHRDTTRWHLPPPPASEMLLSIPVTPRRAAGARETLSWDFEHIRTGSARLVMWWGRTELSLAIEVAGMPSPAVAANVAARYTGRWRETSARDTTRRRDVTIAYDAARRQVTWASSADQFHQTAGAVWGTLLVPRSEDIFVMAYSINNELAHMSSPREEMFVEFTIENGSATGYVRRNAQDQIVARGVRP